MCAGEPTSGNDACILDHKAPTAEFLRIGLYTQPQQQVLLLQAVCCLGQLSFTSCSACGHFLGPSGPRKTSPDLLTAFLGYMSGKSVSAASNSFGTPPLLSACPLGPLVLGGWGGGGGHLLLSLCWMLDAQLSACEQRQCSPDTASVNCVGAAIRQVLFEGRATQDYGRRVLQPNAVPHALALVILLAVLFTRLFGGQILSAMGQAFALLGMGRSSKYKLTNLPSLAIAVRSRLLIGPGSYSMEKHERYGEVFAAPGSSALQSSQGADHKGKGSKKNKVYKTPEA